MAYSYYAGVPTALMQEPRLPEILPANPDAELDRPDWRWVTAEGYRKEYSNGTSLVESEEWRPSRRMDVLVSSKILPFLQRFNHLDGMEQRDELISESPGMFWAAQTYHHDPVTRYLLEAFLVGGAPDIEISKETGVPENYIWWFRQMFFDLGDHRDNRSWMESKVLVPSLMYCEPAFYHQGILWKVIAWMFGWEVFCRNNSMYTLMDNNVMSFLKSLIYAKNDESALIVELTRQINRSTQTRIKEENLKQRELDIQLKRLDGDIDTRNTFEEYAPPIIKAMALSVGKAQVEALLPEMVQNDPDRLNRMQRDHDIIEQSRAKERKQRSEELSDD
jgi:hypothetical protein